MKAYVPVENPTLDDYCDALDWLTSGHEEYEALRIQITADTQELRQMMQRMDEKYGLDVVAEKEIETADKQRELVWSGNRVIDMGEKVGA